MAPAWKVGLTERSSRVRISHPPPKKLCIDKSAADARLFFCMHSAAWLVQCTVESGMINSMKKVGYEVVLRRPLVLGEDLRNVLGHPQTGEDEQPPQVRVYKRRDGRYVVKRPHWLFPFFWVTIGAPFDHMTAVVQIEPGRLLCVDETNHTITILGSIKSLS